MQKLNAGRFFAAMVCFLWAAGQVIEAKETSGPSGRVVFTPLEKAADFNRRSVPLKADGGIQPPSAQTVREQSSLTGFTQEEPPIVTADVQEGIEKHIAEQIKLGNGYFHLSFEGRELKLDLVRVHMEYLATLSPTRHFACVDMVDTEGEFYDVDFFMEGTRGDMKVTETTVHKVNGRPLYLWEQAEDKTWKQVPVDQATDALLGIINGHDTFVFRYRVDLPRIDKKAKVWLPLAQSDGFQQIKAASITAPAGHRTLVDPSYGNKILFFTFGPEHSEKKIDILYDVVRQEKSAYAGDPRDARRYLKPDLKAHIDKYIREAAQQIVDGKEGTLMRARAIYDHVIDSMDYKRCGIGWGQGDLAHARSALSGNCTDFHTYFIALARAAGIPARFAIGASIPSERDEGGVDGYHCWAEFFADGKWYPVDISEANKFTALSMYYFGHHPANRLEFSRGRDLRINPGPSSGPINFLAYPVMEVDGKQQAAKIFFGFERKK